MEERSDPLAWSRHGRPVPVVESVAADAAGKDAEKSKLNGDAPKVEVFVNMPESAAPQPAAAAPATAPPQVGWRRYRTPIALLALAVLAGVVAAIVWATGPTSPSPSPSPVPLPSESHESADHGSHDHDDHDHDALVPEQEAGEETVVSHAQGSHDDHSDDDHSDDDHDALVPNEGSVMMAPAVMDGDWQSKTLEDMFNEYYNIFPSRNRNAASHRWATFILERSQQLTADKVEFFFKGFCPISGSPVEPDVRKLWKYTLPFVTGQGTALAPEGTVYHCCWPCVCDTGRHLKVDTKTVMTSEGSRQFHFLVYGDPCLDPTRIPVEAPDVSCSDEGVLQRATYSDGGHIIVGMYFVADPTPASTDPALGGIPVEEVAAMCEERAQQGYQSGMGSIFIDVAAINPLE